MRQRGGVASLGRSRGGLTTKIHLLADQLGRPLRFILTGGQRNDCTQALALLADQRAKGVIADRGYDTDAIRRWLRQHRMSAIIPPKRNRRKKLRYSKTLYKTRNRIERTFQRCKVYRRLASRFDRRTSYFSAFVALACALIWLSELNVD